MGEARPRQRVVGRRHQQELEFPGHHHSQECLRPLSWQIPLVLRLLEEVCRPRVLDSGHRGRGNGKRRNAYNLREGHVAENITGLRARSRQCHKLG